MHDLTNFICRKRCIFIINHKCNIFSIQFTQENECFSEIEDPMTRIHLLILIGTGLVIKENQVNCMNVLFRKKGKQRFPT